MEDYRKEVMIEVLLKHPDGLTAGKWLDACQKLMAKGDQMNRQPFFNRKEALVDDKIVILEGRKRRTGTTETIYKLAVDDDFLKDFMSSIVDIDDSIKWMGWKKSTDLQKSEAFSHICQYLSNLYFDLTTNFMSEKKGEIFYSAGLRILEKTLQNFRKEYLKIDGKHNKSFQENSNKMFVYNYNNFLELIEITLRFTKKPRGLWQLFATNEMHTDAPFGVWENLTNLGSANPVWSKKNIEKQKKEFQKIKEKEEKALKNAKATWPKEDYEFALLDKERWLESTDNFFENQMDWDLESNNIKNKKISRKYAEFEAEYFRTKCKLELMQLAIIQRKSSIDEITGLKRFGRYDAYLKNPLIKKWILGEIPALEGLEKINEIEIQEFSKKAIQDPEKIQEMNEEIRHEILESEKLNKEVEKRLNEFYKE